eukprot:TRINITY_DN7097_c0_g2_i5.p2 TRINITY_DN7097_c0_g2~~TRINITY_DN7097_c0_g2_i5.p2  ORF type:complete len:116 (+),score=7.03 TRINITY_DN7097_c0_g2_i5:1385-1732(+)
MAEEINALEKNHTHGSLLLFHKGNALLGANGLPQGKRSIGCKWVYILKYNLDGTINRYKTRLVAKGFTQSYGVDYFETFSPIAKLTFIQVILPLATGNFNCPLIPTRCEKCVSSR